MLYLQYNLIWMFNIMEITIFNLIDNIQDEEIYVEYYFIESELVDGLTAVKRVDRRKER